MGELRQQKSLEGGLSFARHERDPDDGAPLYDYRFRRLLPADDWAALPETVRRRFSKRLTGLRLAIYRGEIIASDRTPAGWVFAQLCRVIGAPLPLSGDVGVAAVVTVGEDHRGGQCWTRHYARRHGFPQVIHSAKRFAGETGLEEHVGGGVGMTLNIAARPDGLTFHSADYFWQFGGHRWRLPAWLCPGALTIDHIDIGSGEFLFTLTLHHRWFGEIMHQVGRFRDPAPGEGDLS